jgi:ribosome biogenesis GTPase A
MDGRNFGFFGIISTGKSTIINKLIGRDVAEVGADETTMKIQPYEGQGYRLF